MSFPALRPILAKPVKASRLVTRQLRRPKYNLAWDANECMRQSAKTCYAAALKPSSGCLRPTTVATDKISIYYRDRFHKIEASIGVGAI